MGNRQNDYSSRRPDQARLEPGRESKPESARGRAFDRSEDMGGSGWSGASGRGGMRYGEGGYPERHGEYPQQGGYPREGGYPQQDEYPRESGYSQEGYSQQGGYPWRDPGYFREGVYRGGGYGQHVQHGMAREGSYPREGADHAGGYPRESGFPREFPRERGFGHVPGQRWAGGYGGDVDRGLIAMGRGFSGSHFGPPSQSRPGSNLEHEQLLRGGQRHFGTDVDRGVPLGSNLEHEQLLRGSGYGSQGTDMGMGAPDDRGPHYGKGPKGYKRSDARTHDEVCEAIAHQGDIDASDVDVKIESGIVTLTGTVTHREDKRGLEHLVERLRGVDEVRNELRLKRRAAGEEAGPKSSRGAERQSPASSVAASSPGNGGDPKDQKNGNSARG